MGTNYYARILPTKERKEEIKNAIDKDDFEKIKYFVQQTYNQFSINNIIDDHECEAEGTIHLGKRSGGWKFLWNPNVYVIRNGHGETIDGVYHWIQDPSTAYYVYPLTKKGIKEFIDRKDVVIVDEYEEIQDKDDFFNMALEWEIEEGWDAAGYEAEYSDKQHWKCTGELVDLLKAEGFKFTSNTCSDFYSDGLRFATFTEFS